MNNIIALIPARGGSKKVPKKNIYLLKGYPLIAYSIIACRLSQLIDRIIVSTDSDEIADIAKYFGAEVPFLRPAEISTDTSTDLDFFKHSMEWFQIKDSYIPRYFVHIRPTTPLRDSLEIDSAIRLLDSHPEATSLRSVFAIEETLFKCFEIRDDNFLKPVGKDKRKEFYNLPRQMFPQLYRPNGVVDIIKTETVFFSDSLHGNKMLAFKTINVGEIETIEDFDYIEWRLEKYENSVYNYLKKYY